MANPTSSTEWLLSDQIFHLNHAAVAPWPRRTGDAIRRFVDENLSYGSKDYIQWLKRELQLREQIKTLLNADSTDDIALLKNTSEGLSVIAYGLEWQAGDNVVIASEEFPSNRIVWESLSDRFGVQTRMAELALTSSPEEALISLCDDNTKLLSVSSVQYASGTRMNLEVLGVFCRSKDILFCVDAIQSLGALKFNVKTCHADFVVADAHKWLLGPEGIALFYSTPKARDLLKLNQYGWHMVKDAGVFDKNHWQVAESGQRFECGSPNMLGIVAFNASLSLLLEIGLDEVEKKVLERTQYMIDSIHEHPSLRLNMRTEPQFLSGIVNFQHQHETSEKVWNRLKSANVLCALRGGGIRFSPHYYTPLETIQKAIQIAAN
ncbi:MAG: aminotransferase class V-fold PLP-dependent enzyme [Gammaproteobacteria bacterium]|nr:aminotransferase class V-fold PLP-dependent enzyme [Gammaproteobacteria bacterium]